MVKRQKEQVPDIIGNRDSCRDLRMDHQRRGNDQGVSQCNQVKVIPKMLPHATVPRVTAPPVIALSVWTDAAQVLSIGASQEYVCC